MIRIWKIVNRSLICVRIYKGFLFQIIRNYQSVNSTLEQYESLVKSKNVSFHFDFFYDIFTNEETMSLLRTKEILANSAWAVKLVLCPNLELINEFLVTAGHEITHLDDFPGKDFFF